MPKQTPPDGKHLPVVSSIEQLVGEVQKLTQDGTRWLYRGHADATWHLLPRVHRSYGSEEERTLTQEFRARAGLRHAYRPRYSDYPDWLALMQHYGLPTRLLDWSHSSLTAAFFATQHTMRHSPNRDAPPVDSAIWALAPAVLNKAQGERDYIFPLNAGVLQELVEGAFFPTAPKRQVLAAMAVELDMRMQVQRGAFTVHATPTPLGQMPGNKAWLRKLVIPAAAVRSLGSAIEALGLGLSDLFPDLGSLAQDLAARTRAKISQAL